MNFVLSITVYGRAMTFRCVRPNVAEAIACVEEYYQPQAVFVTDIQTAEDFSAYHKNP